MKASGYESQAIGYFFTVLGFELGCVKDLSGQVNQFQQSPLDPALGDAFLGMGGEYFLIEFKIANSSSLESTKGGVRERMRENLFNAGAYPFPHALDASGERFMRPFGRSGAIPAQYRSVSFRCHFMAEFDAKGSTPTAKFYPYYEDLKPNSLAAFPLDYETFTSLEEFIRQGVIGIDEIYDRSIGVSSADMETYLKEILKGSASSVAGAHPLYCFRILNSVLSWRCAYSLADLLPAVDVPLRT